jgi:hypothetical protein
VGGLLLGNVLAWLRWEVLSQPPRGGRRLEPGWLTFRTLLLCRSTTPSSGWG